MNNNIPAVERTVALLNYLSEAPNGASQLQLKKELGISMSSAYRILQTLLEQHWVRKNSDGVYQLGNGLLPLFSSLYGGMRLMEDLQMILKRTALQNEMACKISVRRGGEQVTLLRAEADMPVSLTGRTGSRFPIVEGSVGAALLCGESEENLHRLLEDCSAEVPEKKDPDILFANLRSVHESGYAVNTNNRWRITALSAPILNDDGTVFGALTFILPELSSKELNKLGVLLKNTARECEAHIYPNGEKA
jgi:DNA-binding IclR family transcriptional regulator